MNDRHRSILAALRTGPETTSTLSMVTGAPEPSVRRLIQELRAMGHSIVFAGRHSGLFRLNTESASATGATA